MPEKGYIQVRAYSSTAQIPQEGVAVAITDSNGQTIAMRITNKNGSFDVPVAVSVPALTAGQTPGTGVVPFTVVNINARLADYEAIKAENVQIFPGVVTLQNLIMIPLSELPGSWNQTEIFNTPPQNL